MTPFEKSLLVLQIQARFAVAEAGAQAAQASTQAEAAAGAAQQATAHRRALSEELRRQLTAFRLNPVMIGQVRATHRHAMVHAISAQADSDRFREAETQLRAELATLRHREQSLKEALDCESQRRIAGAEQRQAIEQGDDWLRGHWRRSK